MTTTSNCDTPSNIVTRSTFTTINLTTESNFLWWYWLWKLHILQLLLTFTVLSNASDYHQNKNMQVGILSEAFSEKKKGKKESRKSFFYYNIFELNCALSRFLRDLRKEQQTTEEFAPSQAFYTKLPNPHDSLSKISIKDSICHKNQVSARSITLILFKR